MLDPSIDPVFTRLDKPSGRVYLSPSGEEYASVTTILHKTAKVGEGIRRWQQKVKRQSPEERYDMIFDWVTKGKIPVAIGEQAVKEDWSIQKVIEWMMHAGAKRGTALHAMIERFFDSGRRVEGEGPYWKSIRPFLDRITLPGPREYHTHHPVMKYSGTLDMLAEVEFVPGVLDWKTADAEKREDWIEDYFLQTTAYAGAVRASRKLMIENGWVVIAIPDREAQVIHLPPDRMRLHWASWCARVRSFRQLAL